MSAQRGDHVAGGVHGGLGRLRGGGPDAHALAYLGGGVGHDTDDGGVVEAGHKRVHGRARDDRDDRLAGADVALEGGQDVGQALGLDGKEHEVGAVDGFEVVCERIHAVGAA